MWTVRFQFHKGTIKTEADPQPETTAQEFQFHKGTIKTLTEDEDLTDEYKYFNSIKVRLKHAITLWALVTATIISIP